MIAKTKKCEVDYIGETARRKAMRTNEHGGKDEESHICLHSTKKKHLHAKEENLKSLPGTIQIGENEN